MLQPKQRGGEIAHRLQPVLAVAAFVDQQITALRLVGLDSRWQRLIVQRLQLGRRAPAMAAIIQHHWQHRRQPAHVAASWVANGREPSGP